MIKNNQVYIGIGTDLGDKLANIKLAYEYIHQRVGKIVRESKIYETKAWGFESKNTFYNSVVEIQCTLTPIDLLVALKKIEKSLGRSQVLNVGYSSRVIDLDIIDYTGVITNTNRLTIPHSHVYNRVFVLKPLFDVAPNWTHSKNKWNLSERLEELLANQEINQVE